MAELNTIKTRLPKVARSLWAQLWGGAPPAFWTGAVSLLIPIVVLLPLASLLFRVSQGGYEVWVRLWFSRFPLLIGNTLLLTVIVVIASTTIAVILAWLSVRTDIPGKRIWIWLSALPLLMPPFVSGLAYIAVFGPQGFLDKLTSTLPATKIITQNIPIFGIFGSSLILTLYSFPYVFLLVSASLRSINVSLEEAAKSLGYSQFSIFLKVTLPLIKPSISAGALLVSLCVLSDFGAVSLMRYETFTSAIFRELVARYDRTSAASLSTLLILITLSIMAGEHHFKGRARFYQTIGTYRPPTTFPLGQWKYPAFLGVLLILFAAFFLPFGFLIYWAVEGLYKQPISLEILTLARNSLLLALITATIASVLSFPIGYVAIRHSGSLTVWINRLINTGYALPGVVVALILVNFFNRYFPLFYGTIVVLIFAYLVRFLPQSLNAVEASLATISPNLEDASRSLGNGLFKTFIKILLPLSFPGIISGWSLVFLNTLKELPATLILRPIGLNTLATGIWTYASEGFYEIAAPIALFLILCAIPPLYLLLVKTKQHPLKEQIAEAKAEQ